MYHTTLPGLGPTLDATSSPQTRASDLLGRYRWYLRQLDARSPRTLHALEEALTHPPTGPGQYELAMVELSRHGSLESSLILEAHAPPTSAREFHSACVILSRA